MSKWNVESARPAIVSSSIYGRIPDTSIPIITTGQIYVPNEKLFHIYKSSLGSWYMEPVNDLPHDLVNKIRMLLKSKPK